MLLQFRFKNYKSFYDENILDLTPSKEQSHENHILNQNSIKVLATTAIHGNNASGKTSVLNALMLMRYFVIYSAMLDKETGLNVPIFKFDKQALKEPSEFEIFVTDEMYEYQYGFKILDKKIKEEWLYRRKISSNKTINKLIFERIENKIQTGKEYTKIKNLFEVIDSDNILFMTILGKRNITSISYVYEFFKNLRYVHDKVFNKEGHDEKVYKLLFEDAELRQKVSDVLKYIDPCIKGLKVEKDFNYLNDKYKIYSIHYSNDNEPIDFDFEKESLGTLKVINTLPHIFNALKNGDVVISDELDNKFHPLVYRKIVSLFYDKNINKNNAQLIFTTHSTFLLNADDMRRDQIMMTEKNKYGKSSLYSLADFEKLRIDCNYEKKYLAGEFGAIPFINKD